MNANQNNPHREPNLIQLTYDSTETTPTTNVSLSKSLSQPIMNTHPIQTHNKSGIHKQKLYLSNINPISS